MPDLKLAQLLEATHPKNFTPILEQKLGSVDGKIRAEDTHLEPPFNYWIVYRIGAARVTLKSFFSSEDYERDKAKLIESNPEQIDDLHHPRGGIAFVPEVNGVLWSFPFDPSMLGLSSSMDGAWIAEVLKRKSSDPLIPDVKAYRPEISAVVAYREPNRRRVIAYGKYSPSDNSGRIYVVMSRLWNVLTDQPGGIRLARPLAFRPEAGLLLQSPVPGSTLGSERNNKLFLDLARCAGGVLPSIHNSNAPFGAKRSIKNYIRRLEDGLKDLSITSPPLYFTLSKLLERIILRDKNTTPEDAGPSHGDYKWDQFLEHRGKFSLIDFEFFCQAEPAFDLGYFCAYLPPSRPIDWRDSAAAEMLRGEFLRSYEDASDMELDLDRVAMYEAAILSIRALSHAWMQRSGWQMRASQLLDLAYERLVNPEPKALEMADALSASS